MASADYTGKDQRLKYLFRNGGGGGGSSTLDGLSDVSLTTPTDGQVLAYDANADEWVNSSTASPSSIASMSDTDIQSPTNGQTLVYNGTSGKWENASGGASGHTYSTTEQVVGTWIDGKPIYEVTIDCGTLANTTSTQYFNHGISDLEMVIDTQAFMTNGSASANLPFHGTVGDGVSIWIELTRIGIVTQSNRSSYRAYVTLRYTKSTD